MTNEYLNKLSDKDINSLVDKLCSARANNPDVVTLDQVKSQQQFYDPVEMEQRGYEMEKESIERDIIRGIFESDTPLSIDEMNSLKANGIYDKYMNKIRNKAEEENAMNSVEDEIRRNLANSDIIEEEETVPEEIVEVIEETSFPEETNNTIEDTNTVISKETDRKAEVKSEIESLSEVANELTDTIKDVTSGKALMEAIDTASSESSDDKDREMTIEEFNDVPATSLTVDDNIIKSVLTESYDNVSSEDAMQLIDVMNRYKSGEKFNVFEALPESLKTVINQEAMSAGADKATINFFAKNFINDLVNNTYIDNEIKDFNSELKEVLSPMNNISGTIMDEYSDEVYEKFTTKMEEEAEKIKDVDPEKAEQLITVSNNYKQAFDFSRVRDNITKTPSNINRAYKEARDSWKKFCNKYREAINNVNPKPRDVEHCLMTLMTQGYSEEYTKTFIVLLAKTITDAIEIGTVEEHIYAYYASNAIYTIAFTNNNSNTNKIVEDNLLDIMNKINEYMVPLTSRNSKKNRKRNKNTRSIAEAYTSGLKDPSYPIKEYHGIIENNK